MVEGDREMSVLSMCQLHMYHSCISQLHTLHTPDYLSRLCTASSRIHTPEEVMYCLLVDLHHGHVDQPAGFGAPLLRRNAEQVLERTHVDAGVRCGALHLSFGQRHVTSVDNMCGQCWATRFRRTMAHDLPSDPISAPTVKVLPEPVCP